METHRLTDEREIPLCVPVILATQGSCVSDTSHFARETSVRMRKSSASKSQPHSKPTCLNQRICTTRSASLPCKMMAPICAVGKPEHTQCKVRHHSGSSDRRRDGRGAAGVRSSRRKRSQEGPKDPRGPEEAPNRPRRGPEGAWKTGANEAQKRRQERRQRRRKEGPKGQDARKKHRRRGQKCLQKRRLVQHAETRPPMSKTCVSGVSIALPREVGPSRPLRANHNWQLVPVVLAGRSRKHMSSARTTRELYRVQQHIWRSLKSNGLVRALEPGAVSSKMSGGCFCMAELR